MVNSGDIAVDEAIDEAQNLIDEALLDKSLLTKQDPDTFAAYTVLLSSLSVQATRLRNLNKKMPRSMRVPDCWFDNLDTNSDHIQTIEDLEFFFVVPSIKLEKVVMYQIKLIELTQLGLLLTAGTKRAIKKSYIDGLTDGNIYAKPGIHKLRVNLVSYCKPEERVTANFAKKHAQKHNIDFAGIPAIGAYAIQEPLLYKLVDGDKIPYFDIIELRSHSIKRAFYCFNLIWNVNYGVLIGLHYDNYDDGCTARPTLIR